MQKHWLLVSKAKEIYASSDGDNGGMENVDKGVRRGRGKGVGKQTTTRMATGVWKGAGTVNIQQEGGDAKSGRGRGRFRGRGRGKGPHVGPLSGIGLWNGIGMSNSKVFIPNGSRDDSTYCQ